MSLTKTLNKTTTSSKASANKVAVANKLSLDKKENKDTVLLENKKGADTPVKNAAGLWSSTVQTSLKIGSPGGKHEKEADAVADKVMNNTGPGQAEIHSNHTISKKGKEEFQPKLIHKKEEEELTQTKLIQRQEEEKEPVQAKYIQRQEEEKEQPVQRKANTESTNASTGVESSINSTKGRGQSLNEETQDQMAASIGGDFSGVRVHTDSTAVQMNKELNSKAFTHGSDIYFNQGNYDTKTTDGKGLLAHELTHTVQQGGANIQTKPGKKKQLSGKQKPPVPLNTSNIKKLRKYLSDDNANAAITLMGSLTVDEKEAVINSREFKELAMSSFGNDDMSRAMQAMRYNLYKSLEWMFDEGTDWESVKTIIKIIPAGKKYVRSDNWMKEKFTETCNDETMAVAVDLLGGTLLEKLTWMKAEGSNWSLVKAKIENTSDLTQRTAIFGKKHMQDFFVDVCNNKTIVTAARLLGGTWIQRVALMKAEGVDESVAGKKAKIIKEHEILAESIREAFRGSGTDEAEVYRVLGYPPATVRKVINYYNDHFNDHTGKGLVEDVKDEFSESELVKAMNLLGKAKIKQNTVFTTTAIPTKVKKDPSKVWVGLIVRGKWSEEHNPGVMEQHADAIVPGATGEQKPVGYFGEGGGPGSSRSGTGESIGLGLKGVSADMAWFLTNRRAYVDIELAKLANVKSALILIPVTKNQAKKFATYWKELKKDPGTFNILGANCSTAAAAGFEKAGVTKEISGLDTPDNLYAQLKKEYKNAYMISGYFGYRRAGLKWKIVGGRLKLDNPGIGPWKGPYVDKKKLK